MNNDSPLYGFRFLFVVTAAFVLLTIPIHLKPDNFIVDDGYFYLVIARNIVLGHGSTFNGIMPTNGYHPLWMLICVCAACITKVSTHLVQLVGTVSDGLVLLSIFLLVYICKVSNLKGATAGIAVIVFMTTTLGICRMLEADLSLTLQLVTLSLLTRWQAKNTTLTRARGLLLGLVLGLALLARLDLIFFACVVFLSVVSFLFAQTGGRRYAWLSKALSVGTACSIVVCPYLYWNYREFGHIVPISGAIKSNFLQGMHLPLYCLPIVIACLLNLVAFAKAKRSAFASIILITSASTLIHLTYSLLFGNVSAWYLTTGYLSEAFCAIWIFDKLISTTRAPARTVAWSGLALFLVLGSLEALRLVSNFTYTRLMNGKVAFRKDYVEPKRALAEEISQMLPQGSRIYVYDGPGGVAFYSGMSIVPLDGLVADYAYNTQLLADGVSKYMAYEKIDYIIAPVVPDGKVYSSSDLDVRKIPGGQVFAVYAPLHHRSAGSFAVRDRDRLATFATIVPDNERSFPEIAIWRVNH